MLFRSIRDGVQSGAFNTAFPAQAARILVELGSLMSQHFGELLLEEHPDASGLRTEVDAFHDAVGRLLGAAPGQVFLVDPTVLSTWFPEAP